MTWGKTNEISLFDVKALYEAAYAEKRKVQCSLRQYRKLMRKAKKWDARYRVQLQRTSYQLTQKGGI